MIWIERKISEEKKKGNEEIKIREIREEKEGWKDTTRIYDSLFIVTTVENMKELSNTKSVLESYYTVGAWEAAMGYWSLPPQK